MATLAHLAELLAELVVAGLVDGGETDLVADLKLSDLGANGDDATSTLVAGAVDTLGGLDAVPVTGKLV